MQGRANQSALLATEPQQQLHLVVDGLRAGFLLQAIGLIPLYDIRCNLHHETAAEQATHMPEGVDRESCGFVFQLVVGKKFVGGLLDRLAALFAVFFFQDLAVALLQSLPLEALLGDGLGLVGGAGGAAAPPPIQDELEMVESAVSEGKSW